MLQRSYSVQLDDAIRLSPHERAVRVGDNPRCLWSVTPANCTNVMNNSRFAWQYYDYALGHWQRLDDIAAQKMLGNDCDDWEPEGWEAHDGLTRAAVRCYNKERKE